MSCSEKIDLENKIFSRAATLGATVDSAQGELFADGADSALQLFISVYNAFFAVENKRFLSEEIRLQRLEETQCWQLFDLEQKRLGPLGRVCCVCFLR